MAVTLEQIAVKETELQKLQSRVSQGDKTAYKTMKFLKKQVFSMKHGKIAYDLKMKGGFNGLEY